MDCLTFSIRLIEALVWPLTVAALIIVLARRPEIRGLVPLLRKLKAGPLEAEFERQIREISEETGEATTPEDETKSDPARTRLIETAKQHPRTAILVAWFRVEVAAMRAAGQNVIGSPSPDVSTPLKAMRELVRAKLVDPDDAALFHELRALRNQAAQIETFEPSVEAALEYVDVARQLELRLLRLAEPR